MQMPLDVEISSHRPVLGPVIVLYKKLVRLVVGPFLRTVFEREHQMLDEQFRAGADRLAASTALLEALSEAVGKQGLLERAREEKVTALREQLAEGRQMFQERLAAVEASHASLLGETITAYTQDILKRTDALLAPLDKRIEVLSVTEARHHARFESAITSLTARLDALGDLRGALTAQLTTYTNEQLQAQQRSTAVLAETLRQHTDEQLQAHQRNLTVVAETLRQHTDEQLQAHQRNLTVVAETLKQHTDEQLQAQQGNLTVIAETMNRHRVELEQRLDSSTAALKQHTDEQLQAQQGNLTVIAETLKQHTDEQLQAQQRNLTLIAETMNRHRVELEQRLDNSTAALNARLAALGNPQSELTDALTRHTDEQLQAQHRDMVVIAETMNRYRLELEQMITDRGRDVRSDLNDVSQDLTLQKRRLDIVLSELRSQIKPRAASLARIAAQQERLLDHAYFLFENRFRGSSELIQKRQGVYLPTFQATQASLGGRFSHILDVACGRGEFLELLKQHEIPARGVDLNEDMVLTCQQKGLEVEHADALAYLEAVPSGSLSGIIACQFIEHLELEALIEFTKLCYDKLAGGGTLVLETVNPLSLVAMRNFYFDLSHQKPIPSHAMSFLLEAVGFAKPETKYLAPFAPEETLDAAGDRNLEKINAYLFGHQDYAVIASK